MDQTIIVALVGAVAVIVGALIALGGVVLQSWLTNKSKKNQSLLEARRVTYAKLLSASISEESYPIFTPDPINQYKETANEDAVQKFNEKMTVWRTNRRNLKGFAAEALLISDDNKLKDELRKFINNADPDYTLKHLENDLRKDISI